VALYNYFRDYDPQVRRYVESDPIGLRGGINAYAFALGNPVSDRDPYGLFDWPPSMPQSVVNAGVGLGDGVIAALTFGRVSGQDLRDVILYTRGTNGGADTCSATYKISYSFGAADELGAEGGAFAAAAGSSTARATYLSLNLLSGGAETAATGEEITSSSQQLQQIVQELQEETAGKSLQPPPGVPNYRY
jgi:uncharacterized protein RhaS with RHS repeats